MTREEAIKILKYQHDNDNMEEAVRQALAMAIEALSAEPKTGEWVRHELWDTPWYTCSECDSHGRNDYKFCPNCGSFNGSEEE